MSRVRTAVSVIAGGAAGAFVLWSAITRGRDRDMYFHAEKQCREIRFAGTADVARGIAERSGGIVESTPQGFTLRFDRRVRDDVACLVDVDVATNKVTDARFQHVDD